MLVLTRLPQQSVVLADAATGRILGRVYVLTPDRLSGRSVRLGFEFAREISICRSEISAAPDHPGGASPKELPS